jgi:hypothetical protein
MGAVLRRGFARRWILAIGQARVTIESVAADPGRMRQRLAGRLIEQDADGQMKRMMSFMFQAVKELLDARLMGNRRVFVGFSARRFRGILAGDRTRS